MTGRIAILAVGLVTGCMGPTWPSDERPAGMEITRSVFASGGFGLRESCDALIVELSDASATRLTRFGRTKRGIVPVPPSGWSLSPMPKTDKYAAYRAAFNGCGHGETLPGDLPGALERPGAVYKILNGGEAILIIVPRAKLAGFFNNG